MALMRASASLQAVPVGTSASAAASTAFRVARRVSRDCSQVLGEGLRLDEVLAVGGDRVQHPERFRLGGAERSAGEDQFAGCSWTDLSHQSLDPAPGERDAEVDLWDRTRDSAAIRRSHAAANTTPPPTQCPWTAAIVTACIASIASAISRPASAASRGRVPAGSPKLARSAPALKARPAPCTITTRTSSRVSNQSAAAELAQAYGRQRVQLRWPVQLDAADRVVDRHGQGLEVRHDETMPRLEGRYRPMHSTAPRIRERGWEPRGVVASFSPLWPWLEQAPLAQSAERLHGKEKVVSSILTGSSSVRLACRTMAT